jgi:hypothetical protein
MNQQKQSKTVIIRDPRAVAIVSGRAQKENRSHSNCAATIILESSSKKTRAKQATSVPANLNQTTHKDSNSSEQKQ